MRLSWGEEFSAGSGAVGVAGEGKDFRVVHEAVDHGRGDDVVGERLTPPAEGQVARDHDRALLVPARDELEEEIRGVLVEGDVSHLIDDDELVSADLLQLRLQLPGVVSGGEPADPVVRRIEQDRVARLGGFHSEPYREVGLPDPGRAEQDHLLRLRLRDERAGRQVREQVPPEAGQVVEVKVLEGLDRGEMGGADPHRGARGLAFGELALQDGGEVFLVGPVLPAGVVGELFPHPPDGRHMQHPGHVRQLRREPVSRFRGCGQGHGQAPS